VANTWTPMRTFNAEPDHTCHARRILSIGHVGCDSDPPAFVELLLHRVLVLRNETSFERLVQTRENNL
jgi:hypothetical protein